MSKVYVRTDNHPYPFEIDGDDACVRVDGSLAFMRDVADGETVRFGGRNLTRMTIKRFLVTRVVEAVDAADALNLIRCGGSDRVTDGWTATEATDAI